jgi:GNAT superfamily N-acetyltransferase
MLAFLDGKSIGFCLFFHNYSTFLGKPGLYLEDLYIQPEYRNRGFGRKILSQLAGLAIERGCGRFEWAVLDWNDPAIQFYRNIGAEPINGWTVQRITGHALLALAGSKTSTQNG